MEGQVDSYVSVANEVSTEIVVRRSRFIGYLAPIAGVDEAESFLDRLRERYRDASHVCFAYRIGLETTTTKMSDDGEPKGTAGRPILDVLERRGIENACLAVVRYFGGTLLGAAGLTRAYAQAAAAVIDASTVVTYAIHTDVHVQVSYGDWSKLEHLFPHWGAQVVDVQYGEHVGIEAYVPADRTEDFASGLSDATGGNAHVALGAKKYRPVAS